MLLPAHEMEGNHRNDTAQNDDSNDDTGGVLDTDSDEHRRKPGWVLVGTREEFLVVKTYQKGPRKAQVLRTKLTKTPILPASST